MTGSCIGWKNPAPCHIADDARGRLVNTDKRTKEPAAEEPQADVEMQAIGYPPPADQVSFARKLAEIIQRALRREKRS